MSNISHNFWNPLFEDLIDYARREVPAAIDLIGQHLTNTRFVLVCLGRLVQRRSTEDHEWMYSVIRRWPDDFLSLTPYIGTVTIQGFITLPPEGNSWSEHVKQLDQIDGISLAGKECEVAGQKALPENAKTEPKLNRLFAA